MRKKRIRAICTPDRFFNPSFTDGFRCRTLCEEILYEVTVRAPRHKEEIDRAIKWAAQKPKKRDPIKDGTFRVHPTIQQKKHPRYIVPPPFQNPDDLLEKYIG